MKFLKVRRRPWERARRSKRMGGGEWGAGRREGERRGRRAGCQMRSKTQEQIHLQRRLPLPPSRFHSLVGPALLLVPLVRSSSATRFTRSFDTSSPSSTLLTTRRSSLALLWLILDFMTLDAPPPLWLSVPSRDDTVMGIRMRYFKLFRILFNFNLIYAC